MRISHGYRAAAALLAAALTLVAAGCAGHGARSRPLAVAVDVGHSPADSGATSARGVPEHTYNRKLAQELIARLHAAGHTRSFLIQASGADPSLRERASSAVARGADLLISVHHDSVRPRYLMPRRVDGRAVASSEGISGYSLFYAEAGGAGAESLHLAKEIGGQLRAAGLTPSLHHAEEIPGEARTLVDETLGIYRFDQLIILRTPGIPSVLFEAGVIVDRDEELRLRDPTDRERIARAIARAVTRFAAGSR